LKKIRLGADRAKEGVHFTALREIKFLSDLRHPNVLLLHETFQHKNNIFLVLDVMHTDLEIVIKAKQIPLPLSDIEHYVSELFSGVAFLHESWILHRDLKPSNILLSSDGSVRLADFGLARSFGGVRATAESMTHQIVTRWYRAPELLFGARHYGVGVDAWALGCIFAELLLRGPFLAGESDLDQLAKIVHALGTPDARSWPGCTALPDFVEFQACEGTPLKQIFVAADEMTLDLLAALMRLDPRRRITPVNALTTSPYLRRVAARAKRDVDAARADRTLRLAAIGSKVATAKANKRPAAVVDDDQPTNDADTHVRKKLMLS